MGREAVSPGYIAHQRLTDFRLEMLFSSKFFRLIARRSLSVISGFLSLLVRELPAILFSFSITAVKF